MSTERLKAAEQNIEQIRNSVGDLRVEEARQTEQLSAIRETLVRHDGQFKEITNSLNVMSSTLQDIAKTLAVNTQSLQEHMRRTELLEKHTTELMKFKWQTLGIIAFVVAVSSYIGGLFLK